MNGESESEAEVERLRLENQRLRNQLRLFLEEHRFAGKLSAVLMLGPGLVRSFRIWFLKSPASDPLPPIERKNLQRQLLDG